MAGKGNKRKQNLTPRIENRRALHEYHIESRLECGMVLQGSEVKSLRAGRATLQDSFAKVENGELILHNLHIEPYEKAPITAHEPKRSRKLLAHRREIKKLENSLADRGGTLVPLAVYFKESHAKVEIAVARGKQEHDKRRAIREKEMDRELRRATSVRQ